MIWNQILLRRTPQTRGEIPRAEETLSPGASKTTSQAPEPLSPSEIKGSPSPVKAPSPQKASPAKTAPSPSTVGAPLSPKPLESPKTTPLSPQSHGLDSAGEVPLNGNSAQPQLEGSPQ
jgi:hypothetical protein